MTDPYKILGVLQNATEDEIKDAYRILARKYQADSYGASPLNDIAKEKMRELDEAYDAIITARRSSTSQSSEKSNSSSSYGYHDVRMKISSGRIDDAEIILNGVPEMQRDAEWHFLKGTIQYKRGWLEEAFSRFSDACRMDPTNKEYRAALDRLNNQRSGGFRQTTVPSGCTACDCCTSLLCANCCCNCFGRSCC